MFFVGGGQRFIGKRRVCRGEFIKHFFHRFRHLIGDILYGGVGAVQIFDERVNFAVYVFFGDFRVL